MYVYVGVPNCETACHMSRLFGTWYTHILKLPIKQIHAMLDYQMTTEVFLFYVGVPQMKVW